MKNGPSRKLPRCQIISVDCAQLQMNSARNAWRNETADGASLAAGHYLVMTWPAGAIRSSYLRAPRYLGPHATAAARMLQISAVSLGIVEPMPSSATHAASRHRAEGRGFAPTVDGGAKPLAALPFCADGR